MKKGLKAIVYDTDIISKDNIIWGLLENGIDTERSKIIAKLKDVDNEQVMLIANEVKQYDFAFTQNFSRTVAEGCHVANIPYFSWIWDSPQLQLYFDEAFYETNFIFAFDKVQVKKMKEYGLKKIWWIPLCANVTKASLISVSDDDILKYGHDISFIGSLYEKESFYDTMPYLPSDIQNEVEKVFDEQCLKWEPNNSRIYGKLSEKTREYIISRMPKNGPQRENFDWGYFMETLLLAYEMSSRDRTLILNKLSLKHDVALYTGNREQADRKVISSVNIFPKVNEEEAYKIYYSSKINLNVTIPSIETGIPLRVFDIMAVGGCVFSNYQEEIEEIFMPGKEIVVFSSLDELEDKVRYYLSHNEERLKIGINGYKKVKNIYNVPNAVKKMVKLAYEEI